MRAEGDAAEATSAYEGERFSARPSAMSGFRGGVSRSMAGLPSSGAVSRDEMNLAEFPLTVLSTRVDPKVKTLEFSDFQRGKDGELTERKWIITGADKFGLPTATDDDVILGLIRLTMDDGFRSRKIYFTRYELLRALKWSTEGRSYTRLVRSLDRLSGVRIRASNAFYDNSSKSYQTRNFGIIDAYELNDHRATRKKPKKRLNRSVRERSLGEGEDELENGKSYFLWSEMLFNSFRSGFIKKLDLDLYFTLRSSVSRRLYRYLDKHFYFRPVIERPLMFLAFEKLGISRNYKYVSSVKQQLEPAAEELMQVGYLSGYEFAGRGEQAIVRFHAAKGGERREGGSAREPGRGSAEPARAPVMHPSSQHRAATTATERLYESDLEPRSGRNEIIRGFSGAEEGRDPAGYGSPDWSLREGRAAPAGGSGSFAGGTDEAELRRLYSQLIEALVSRGISIMQAKRLLADREQGELVHIDRIVSYYDWLVENHDTKVSRNKVGFLYRAVENPMRFQIPATFQDGGGTRSALTADPRSSGRAYPQARGVFHGSSVNSSAGHGSSGHSPESLHGGETRYPADSGRSSRSTSGGSLRQSSPIGRGTGPASLNSPPHFPPGAFPGSRSASRPEAQAELEQARLRRSYFEFVSREVSQILATLPEQSRDELKRRVEEKMSCLGTALSKERFDEAVQGCMREEISRQYDIPDFRRWLERQPRA